MMNEAFDGRRQRGLEIAATARIVKKGDEWLVPSQSLNGRYRVFKGPNGFNCNCPDFELRQQPCKHSIAVTFVLQRETKTDGSVIETRAVRVTYPQANWPAYHRAQVNEKEMFCGLLRDLVADVPSPEQKRGRPALPVADAIFASALKVYTTQSTRRFMTDLRTAHAFGFIGRTMHYNSVISAMDSETMTPVLHELITRSALPLKGLETDFAVDSTGFGVQSFYRHYNAKYGHDQYSQDYLKLHVMVGTKTNVITAAAVTDRDTHDSPMMPGLVAATVPHFNVTQVAADKGYSSHKNVNAVAALGATPFIAFNGNAKGNSNNPLWNKLFHFFQMNRDEFLERYHTRSNVESVFSSLKRKFRDTLRSKTLIAQQNELLLMVLCHNIVCVIHEIHESGATAMFPSLSECSPRKASGPQSLLGWD